MPANNPINHRIVLASRPQKAATLDCFRLESSPVDDLREGELLLRTVWLSLDPYMRGRMSDAPSYAPPVAIGHVMTAETVARVERSRHPNFREGDWVLAPSGWQEYAVSAGQGIAKLAPQIGSPSHALGVLGMPGFTAFIGLLDIGQPRPRDTVVVAAATGERAGARGSPCTGADDCDCFAGQSNVHFRIASMFAGVVHRKALQASNGDGLVVGAQYARTFAQLLHGAHARTSCAKKIGGEDCLR